MKRLSLILLFVLSVGGARLGSALDGESTGLFGTERFASAVESASAPWGALFSPAFGADPAPSGDAGPAGFFSSVVRGNFGALEIAPFRFRVVGTSFGQWADRTWEDSSLADFLGADDPLAESLDLNLKQGFKSRAWGETLGVDWLLTENTLVGFHAVNVNMNIDPEEDGYDGSLTAVGGLVRFSYSETRWYWDVSLGGSRNRNRAELFATDDAFLEKRDVTQMNYHTELGLKLSSGFTHIEPFVGARYITLSAGGLDPFDPEEYDQTRTPASARLLVGSRFSWEYATPVATIRPGLTGTWSHEFGDETIFTTDDTFLFPIATEFGGEMFSRDRAILGTSVAAQLRDMVDLFCGYSYIIAPYDVSYSVSGGFHIKY